MRLNVRVLLIALCVLLLTLLLAVFQNWFSYMNAETQPPLLLDALHPANMDILAPAMYPAHRFTWITENQQTTHALFRCIEHGNCAQNKTKGASCRRVSWCNSANCASEYQSLSCEATISSC
jgi:hypothetical protein